MRGSIKSELRFVWKFLLSVFLLPFIFLMVIFGKKSKGDLLKPFDEFKEFIFEAKFTFFIVFLTILTSFVGWYFASEALWASLVNYPSDLLDFNRWYTLFSSGFIHINFGHLFGNMFVLFLFGRIVERNLGTKKMIFVYFFALFISSVGDCALNLIFNSGVGGSIGASGAIMGIVAVAMLMEPFYITFSMIIPLPVFLVGWLSIYGDLVGILNPNQGIAHFAHLFGFISVSFLVYFSDYEDRAKLKKGLYINIFSVILFLLLSFFFF